MVMTSESLHWTSGSAEGTEPQVMVGELLLQEAPGCDHGQFPGRARWMSSLALSGTEAGPPEVETKSGLSLRLRCPRGSDSLLALAALSQTSFLSPSSASVCSMEKTAAGTVVGTGMRGLVGSNAPRSLSLLFSVWGRKNH